MNMNRTVLDASALLALLHAEDGSERVEYALPDSVIASVNLAEVFAALVDRGLSTFEVRDAIEGLALTVVPFDETLAYETSFISNGGDGESLSLGDRACLALAQQMNATAMTADHRWRDLDLSVDVEVVC